MQAKRSDIIASARACKGTPFRHQGRLLGIGLDCAGVLLYVGNRHGQTPQPNFKITGYARYPNELEVRHWLRLLMDPVHDLAARKFGDTVVIADHGHAVHLGILVPVQFGDGAALIHASERAGGVVEHPLNAAWCRQIRAVYRFRSLED
jgi:cell wall-associated NlpC family hydrolase